MLPLQLTTGRQTCSPDSSALCQLQCSIHHLSTHKGTSSTQTFPKPHHLSAFPMLHTTKVSSVQTSPCTARGLKHLSHPLECCKVLQETWNLKIENCYNGSGCYCGHTWHNFTELIPLFKTGWQHWSRTNKDTHWDERVILARVAS